MTYAESRLRQIYRPEMGIVVLLVNTAVGNESSVLSHEYTRSVENYFLPYSRQWANPLSRFLALKSEWETETAHLSSITEISMHAAYQQIIGMGTIAVPYILAELKIRPSHWFWALKSITGEDPVLTEHRGRIKQMTETWLRWGKEQGYL